MGVEWRRVRVLVRVRACACACAGGGACTWLEFVACLKVEEGQGHWRRGNGIGTRR